MAVIHRKKNTDIQHDPNIQSLLARMPSDEVKNSFSTDQLENLKIAVGARDWKTHPVDIRFTLPFFGKRYYVVFIAGKSKRSGRLQKLLLRRAEILFISLFVLGFIFVAIVVLYLLKSALGINLFDGFSLGLWDWFKA